MDDSRYRAAIRVLSLVAFVVVSLFGEPVPSVAAAAVVLSVATSWDDSTTEALVKLLHRFWRGSE